MAMYENKTPLADSLALFEFFLHKIASVTCLKNRCSQDGAVSDTRLGEEQVRTR